MSEQCEPRDDIVSLVAACAVDHEEPAAIRQLLRPDAELLRLYDRFVQVEGLMRRAGAEAPPAEVDAALLARLGLDRGAGPRPNPRPWLVAASLAATAVIALGLWQPWSRPVAYRLAGAPVETTLPDALTLADGEQLLPSPAVKAEHLPCRIFAAGNGTALAISCIASDGTRQTILMEP